MLDDMKSHQHGQMRGVNRKKDRKHYEHYLFLFGEKMCVCTEIPGRIDTNVILTVVIFGWWEIAFFLFCLPVFLIFCNVHLLLL